MRASNLCVWAGACAGIVPAATAQDRPPLQRLESAILVQPLRVAQCRLERGQVVQTSDWLEYGADRRGPTDARVFDCFGDADSDGVPDDDLGCGMGSNRWYFGTAYCNGFATNDMYDIDAVEPVGYGRADLAWYWGCPVEEQCVVAVFTQESDPRVCEPDSLDYSGWMLDFGPLECHPDGYYYTNADISSLGVWPAVTGGAGSYIVAFLTSSGSALATCAQPMLWGIPDDPDWPGRQDKEQIDDDNPLDGSHDTVSECYTYAFGVCPDPLGTMLQFWGEPADQLCESADCNRDGTIDTQDFLCFLGLWASGNAEADCNGDGLIDTRDFLCFLAIWSDCR